LEYSGSRGIIVGGVTLVRILMCIWRVKNREKLGVLITWCVAVVAAHDYGEVMNNEINTYVHQLV